MVPKHEVMEWVAHFTGLLALRAWKRAADDLCMLGVCADDGEEFPLTKEEYENIVRNTICHCPGAKENLLKYYSREVKLHVTQPLDEDPRMWPKGISHICCEKEYAEKLYNFLRTC
mgnify:CR=1 FL=1